MFAELPCLSLPSPPCLCLKQRPPICFIWAQFVFTSDLQCKHFLVAWWQGVKGKHFVLGVHCVLTRAQSTGPEVSSTPWASFTVQTQHNTVKYDESSGFSCLCSSSSVICFKSVCSGGISPHSSSPAASSLPKSLLLSFLELSASFPLNTALGGEFCRLTKCLLN